MTAVDRTLARRWRVAFVSQGLVRDRRHAGLDAFGNVAAAGLSVARPGDRSKAFCCPLPSPTGTTSLRAPFRRNWSGDRLSGIPHPASASEISMPTPSSRAKDKRLPVSMARRCAQDREQSSAIPIGIMEKQHW